MGIPLTHPLTRHIRAKGSTLKYWAKVHRLSYNVLCQVINGRSNNIEAIEALKADGLWDYIPKLVRNKISNT